MMDPLSLSLAQLGWKMFFRQQVSTEQAKACQPARVMSVHRGRVGYPHGHRKTTTLVAGLRMTGMVAPMVLDGPINGDWFEAYVSHSSCLISSAATS